MQSPAGERTVQGVLSGYSDRLAQWLPINPAALFFSDQLGPPVEFI